ncbi:hypothetical protein Goklo_028823 [Gossypium klotzschianum]|nr:hypothetical protein [Gossypium klotzschianum]
MTLPTTQGQTVPDAWHNKGHPVDRSKSGGWTSAAMILGVEACEMLTTLGIVVNLVTYLTETMHLALGTGGLKSSVSGFGSDQFDETDPEERSQMSNFFNCYLEEEAFEVAIGSIFALQYCSKVATTAATYKKPCKADVACREPGTQLKHANVHGAIRQ